MTKRSSTAVRRAAIAWGHEHPIIGPVLASLGLYELEDFETLDDTGRDRLLAALAAAEGFPQAMEA